MSTLNWTDEQITPAQRAPRNSVRELVAELAQHPGRWAEVARYPHARRRSAYSRGSQTCTRYPELEYAVTRDGAESVLHFRHLPFERINQP